MTAKRASPTRMLAEPEDADITGLTRSLTRRLLALNIHGSLRRPILVDTNLAH